ncbi:hypothetical protein [Castellaniella sp. UC4442_H9]
MMNRRGFLSAAMVMAVVGLAGCKSEDGKKFVGNWQAVGGGSQAHIEPDGDSYLITIKVFGMTDRYSGVVDGKHLIVKGASSSAWIIDEKTGHLVIGGLEMARVK